MMMTVMVPAHLRFRRLRRRLATRALGTQPALPRVVAQRWNDIAVALLPPRWSKRYFVQSAAFHPPPAATSNTTLLFFVDRRGSHHQLLSRPGPLHRRCEEPLRRGSGGWRGCWSTPGTCRADRDARRTTSRRYRTAIVAGSSLVWSVAVAVALVRIECLWRG